MDLYEFTTFAENNDNPPPIEQVLNQSYKIKEVIKLDDEVFHHEAENILAGEENNEWHTLAFNQIKGKHFLNFSKNLPIFHSGCS